MASKLGATGKARLPDSHPMGDGRGRRRERLFLEAFGEFDIGAA